MNGLGRDSRNVFKDRQVCSWLTRFREIRTSYSYNFTGGVGSKSKVV